MSSMAHPLPSAPDHNRDRAKSNFSLRSNHSKNSSGSNQKVDLYETHNEKESRRIHGKADPLFAMTEAEPSAVASGGQTSLASIRAIQHRDNLGNPIVDPDKSNPTRSRWERPLDTIRSFEAAIDGGYSRKSYTKTESGESPARRSSYYGNQGPTTDEKSRYASRSQQRPQSQRPESHYMGRPDSYYNAMDTSNPSNGYHPNRARYPRAAAEPQYGHGVYPAPQPSYETVTTASGSGSSSEPAGYLTDPSSDNSSLDRIAGVGPKEPSENYGFDGFGGSPQYAPSNGFDQHASYESQGNGYGSQGPPPVPQKGASSTRKPIQLGSTSGNAGLAIPDSTPVTKEKRKSWLGRRFSKDT